MSNSEILEIIEEVRRVEAMYQSLLNRIENAHDSNYKSFYDYKKEEENNQHHEV